MSRKGPFGLCMGMTTGDFDVALEEIAPGKYRITSVPKPHSAFEAYILQITPENGLSWIKAVGKTIQTSVYGIELKSAFDSMKTKLAATYGKYQISDFLLRDSIWNEPRDWMQSILNKERILAAFWEPAHGSTLGDSLNSVALVTGVIDTTSGYVAIEYSFENVQASEMELAALEDEAL